MWKIGSVEMGLLSKLQLRVLSFTASPTRTLEKRSDAIELIRKCSELLAVDAVGEFQRVEKSSRDFTAKPLLCFDPKYRFNKIFKT